MSRRSAAARRQEPSADRKVIHLRSRTAPAAKQSVQREVIAVLLWCTGLLTLLALASYSPADVSLNASSTAKIRNWIGPAGSYWADILLQMIGVGAYALASGMLLTGFRAFSGRRLRPHLREAIGTIMLVVAVGTFAQLCVDQHSTPYPAGGVLGAILAQVLVARFAIVGALILSGTMALLALTITADGILLSLGLRGLGVLRETAVRGAQTLIAWRERRRQRAALLAAAQSVPLPEETRDWEMATDALTDLGQRVGERLQEARDRGRAQGEADAGRDQHDAKLRALRATPEPAPHLDDAIDLVGEDTFAFAAPEPAALAAPEPEPREPIVPQIHAAEPDIALGEQDRPQSTTKHLIKRRKRSEPEIVDVRPPVDVAAIESASAQPPTTKDYELPPPSLLDFQMGTRQPLDQDRLRDNAQRLIKTLRDYGIEGQVREIRPGPVITMYEFVPAPGTKISKIANLADDLAMSMEALRVRIVAPIPGKGAVGIEIPNESVETVYLKELVTHERFRSSRAALPLALGKDIEGTPFVADLARMPHLLVAGATGAGKSVSINSMIMSFLYKASPRDVRMIMVDPKMLELSVYEGIPHLLLPVVTDPKKAAMALRWGVNEMERRYKLLSAVGVRNIEGYNRKVAEFEEGRVPSVAITDRGGNEEQVRLEHLPYVVIVVDELADLMMVASRDVEASIMRLAQMARAAGIHLILATQRPSVDVITGVIKANFPTRIAFQVASKHDSRTILDGNGAEHLLGKGDMLFLSAGAGGIRRLHGSYVSDAEIERSVTFAKDQGAPQYDESILAAQEEEPLPEEESGERDEVYDQAVAIVAETRQASISMIQRRLRIGYNRAARLVEQMEKEGIVGQADGAKPREVLVPPPIM